jgi:hypothetical protein
LYSSGLILLVLDGLEKAQDDGGGGGIFGVLQDRRLSDLLVRVAEKEHEDPLQRFSCQRFSCPLLDFGKRARVLTARIWGS